MAVTYKLSVEASEPNPAYKPTRQFHSPQWGEAAPESFSRGVLSVELTEAQWEWLRTAALEAWRKA